MLRQLGRSGALGLALGASAALGLLALVLYQELRSRRRRCQQQEVLGAAAPPPRPAVGTEHLDAQGRIYTNLVDRLVIWSTNLLT